MTATDTTNTTSSTPATTTGTTAKADKETKHRLAYPTAAEAEAVKPEGTKLKLFEVTDPSGVVRFTWAGDMAYALAQVAKVAGWKAAVVGAKAPKAPDKAAMAAHLAAMTPEERAALIAQYVPATTPPAAPTPTQPQADTQAQTPPATQPQADTQPPADKPKGGKKGGKGTS